jgi:hypothetical protein
MDEGRILLITLAKGKIGEESAALLGALLVARIDLTGLAHTAVRENERRDFYVYLDEFQNFTTLSLANVLSELRRSRARNSPFSIPTAHSGHRQRLYFVGSCEHSFRWRGYKLSTILSCLKSKKYSSKNTCGWELQKLQIKLWRRGWDSNPRHDFS